MDDIYRHIYTFLTLPSKKKLSRVSEYHHKIIWPLLQEDYYFSANFNVTGAKKIYDITRAKDCKNYPGLTHVAFHRDFNGRIKNHIPYGVTHIIFGEFFNDVIRNRIPSSVTHLTFGNSFDQSIKNAIPNSVTHLRFGWHFNEQVKGHIPHSVTHLTFDYP